MNSHKKSTYTELTVPTHAEIVRIFYETRIDSRCKYAFQRLGANAACVKVDLIPFPVSIKNTGFGLGYSADDITRAFESVVQADIAASRQNGNPVARYDREKRQAYLETPDGTREYVNA